MTAPPLWVVLARLARLAKTGSAEIADKSKELCVVSASTEGGRVSLTGVKIYGDDPYTYVDAPVSDRGFAEAEQMSVAWGEAAVALQGESRAGAPDRSCHLCRAPAGTWCVPRHPGERDGGGWCHPEREAKGVDDDRDEVRDVAVRWALKYRSTGRGYELTSLDDLSRSVLAIEEERRRYKGLAPLSEISPAETRGAENLERWANARREWRSRPPGTEPRGHALGSCSRGGDGPMCDACVWQSRLLGSQR